MWCHFVVSCKCCFVWMQSALDEKLDCTRIRWHLVLYILAFIHWPSLAMTVTDASDVHYREELSVSMNIWQTLVKFSTLLRQVCNFLLCPWLLLFHPPSSLSLNIPVWKVKYNFYFSLPELRYLRGCRAVSTATEMDLIHNLSRSHFMVPAYVSVRIRKSQQCATFGCVHDPSVFAFATVLWEMTVWVQIGSSSSKSRAVSSVRIVYALAYLGGLFGVRG